MVPLFCAFSSHSLPVQLVMCHQSVLVYLDAGHQSVNRVHRPRWGDTLALK